MPMPPLVCARTPTPTLPAMAASSDAAASPLPVRGVPPTSTPPPRTPRPRRPPPPASTSTSDATTSQTAASKCSSTARREPSAWTTVSRVLLVLSLLFSLACARPAHASPSTTEFTVHTTEKFQVSVLAGSERATVGWTPLSDTVLRVTVAIRPQPRPVAWIGFGVAQTTGLGTSLMTGGPMGGVAVVARSQTVSDAVKEYSMAGMSTDRMLAWLSTGPSLALAQRCGVNFCSNQVAVCVGQPLCKEVLQCAQNGYVNIGVNDTISDFLSNCTKGITSNPNDPVQIQAIASLLDATGCFVQNCGRQLQGGVHFPNLNASSFVSDGDSVRLSFVTTTGKIAHGFIPRISTFLVAFSTDSPGSFNAHGPNKASFTVNVASGVLTSIPTPSYLVPHIIVAVLGLAVCFPLGLVMRACVPEGFLHVLIAFVAFILGVASIVIITSSDPAVAVGSSHSLLGVIVIALVALVSIVSCLQPRGTSSRTQAWQDAVLNEGQKDELREGKREQRFYFAAALTMSEIVAAILVCACLFTGVENVRHSTVVSPDNVEVAAYAGTASCVVCLVAIGLVEWRRRQRANERRRIQREEKAAHAKHNNNNNPKNNASSNPKFKSNEELLFTDPADDPSSVIDVPPLTLSWQNVTIHAPVNSRREVEGKTILSDAMGFCGPRTLTACLGPSGAGKSTLMEILCMRSVRTPTPRSAVYVNGIPANKFPGFARYVGYVPQQDVLHEYLTVLETLQFASQMVLPYDMTEERKVERVIRVIVQLGIVHVLDALVGGGSNVRGLSGGERRRVSIAIQMIKSPSILFLDEPTSGLDAHMALKLCESLRDLANEGRTVFATVHQPSLACFELFDRVVLLAGGKTVWSGSRTAAVQFIKDVGRPCPAHWNPADWYLTVVDFNRDDRFAQSTTAAAQAKKQQQPNHTDRMSYGEAEAHEVGRRLGGPVTAHNIRRRSLNATATTRVATALSAQGLDVAELRDAIVAYYEQVNPEKLVSDPGVIEDIVKFALAKGIDMLEARLNKRYGTSVLPFIYRNRKAVLNMEPMSREEVGVMEKSFRGSAYGKELLGQIARANEQKRTTPGSPNSLFSAARLPSETDDGWLASSSSSGEGTYAQPFMSQIKILALRSIRLAVRNPSALKFQAIQNIVFGLLLGSLYSQVKSITSSPAFQLGLAMAIILAMVAFVTLSLGTQVAYSDRLVFEREMSDSMYSPMAHFVQRLIVGVPVASIIALCLILPSYFWIGLDSNGDAFFFFVFVNIAVVFLFDSVVFALTLVTNDVNTAYQFGNFYEAITIFFSGVFIPIFAMPIYYRWLYFLSPFAYAFGAVVVSQFDQSENDFFVGASGVVIRNPWINLLLVLVIGVAWRLLGLYGVMRLWWKKKSRVKFAENVDSTDGGLVVQSRHHHADDKDRRNRLNFMPSLPVRPPRPQNLVASPMMLSVSTTGDDEDEGADAPPRKPLPLPHMEV